MEEQSVGFKDINSLGYDVIATVYQTEAFKAGIKFDNTGADVRPGTLNNVLKQAGLRW